MSKARKAAAAFIVAILALPIADWIGGGETFSMGTVLGAIIAAAGSALAVYMTPNSP